MTGAVIEPKPSQVLADRIADQRTAKANACRMNARAHGVSTHWGRVYTAEAEQWDAAARRARFGDLAPFTLAPVELDGPTPSTVADDEADGVALPYTLTTTHDGVVAVSSYASREEAEDWAALWRENWPEGTAVVVGEA